MINEIDRCLRTSEAAKALGLHRGTLAQLRVTGDGPPYIKIGRAVRYPERLLLEWRDARIRTSTTGGANAA